ncbi:MAG: hypothetical protein AAB534_01065 [Patescibacteria group bacterium]
MLLATDRKAKVRLRRLARLDFTQIKAKLCSEMPGWNAEKAELIEKWYRRFLQVILFHPQAKIVPNTLVDDFWHAHILDTKKYMLDCQNVFGHFVHHEPSYGEEKLEGGYDETNALFRETFGEDQTVLEPSRAGKKCRKKCRRKCGSIDGNCASGY